MTWAHDSITPGELDALRRTAALAWADDTRYPLADDDRPDRGQCYVTSRWLVDRLGGRVGRKEGHYVWMDASGEWIIDLTDHHRGGGYGRYLHQSRNEEYTPLATVDNKRTERFTKRANQIFDNLGNLIKIGLDVGDAFPAEEPQRAEDLDLQQYHHDEPDFEPETKEYKFVYGNGQMEISPDHGYSELAQHAGLGLDHTGPMAVGYVSVIQGRATWEVQSNVNIKALERVFKEYSKQVGWSWGGITNVEGEPIDDQFAPKKSRVLGYVYDESADHLWLSSRGLGELAARLGGSAGQGQYQSGRLEVRGRRVDLLDSLPSQAAIHSLLDFCSDRGLELYAGNDNALHTIPDLQQNNLGDADGMEPVERLQPEHDPNGLIRCPLCQQLCPNWHEYQDHRRTKHNTIDKDGPVEDGKFPQIQMDREQDALPTNRFTPQQPYAMPVAKTQAQRVDGFKGGSDDDSYFVAYEYGSPVGYARVHEGHLTDLHAVREAALPVLQAKVIKYTEKQPKDLLEAPVPFVFDIDEDKITVGKPGQRTSDIPGKFSPGGIVEGTYEPGGKVVVRTMTSTPYSVNHMVTLWYYEHPELSVTSVYLMDDAGGKSKLAADTSIGSYVSSLVAADPVADAASKALQAAGGRAFAVGGAVRDAVRGKEPKDIDLMVSGLPADQVHAILSKLPGQVDLTGKDFGVFRYREGGHEVEIALPRKERSTGEGHKDFSVQGDHTMSPEEDLYRRDFTANAMAVDLKNGKLIDPYNGVGDVQKGTLRAVSPTALSEDPLRVVRALGSASRHGLYPDMDTMNQMQTNAPSLQHLPSERIQAELDKIFEGENPAQAIRLAHDTGVLPHVLPEVDRAFGFNQNNPHHELELGDHLLKVLDRTSKLTDDKDVRLAALLHDIGKPDSAWPDPDTGSYHYYEKHMPDGTVLGADHEGVGADMTCNLMTRLNGYSTDRVRRVSDLVQHHMWPAFTSPKGARKFLHRVGDHADDLFTLREADQGGKSYSNDPSNTLPDLDQQKALVDQVRNQGQATTTAQLAINGNDLIGAGIPQSPQIGEILRHLTQQVIEDPSINQPQILLQMAQDYIR